MRLQERIAAIPVERLHRSVAKALSVGNALPSFRLACVDDRSLIFRDGRILDASHAEIARDAGAWIRTELEAAGTRWRERYDALRERPPRRTSIRIVPLYFVARVGERPSDVWQALVDLQTEYPASEPWPERSGRERIEDLWDAGSISSPDESAPPIGVPRYRLRQLTHLAAFIERDAATQRRRYAAERARAATQPIGFFDEETGIHGVTTQAAVFYPMPQRASRLERWFEDWEQSSAGRSGTRPEAHWVFQLREGVWKEEPYSEAIPRWVTRRALPAFGKARLRDLRARRDWLEAFDRKAGHPFAWFFYMVHGDRIPCEVGREIAEAQEAGLQWLPAHDRAIVHRWALRPYAF